MTFTLWMGITWAAALGIVVVIIFGLYWGYCERNKK